jgi:hypothetical protein
MINFTTVNSNLAVILLFILLFLILFWIMPNRKSAVVVRRFLTISKAISIQRLIIIIIEYLKE